jgi:hypothetical protein
MRMIVTLEKLRADCRQASEDKVGAVVKAGKAQSVKPVVEEKIYNQEILVTLAACGPFCPCTISNST